MKKEIFKRGAALVLGAVMTISILTAACFDTKGRSRCTEDKNGFGSWN